MKPYELLPHMAKKDNQLYDYIRKRKGQCCHKETCNCKVWPYKLYVLPDNSFPCLCGYNTGVPNAYYRKSLSQEVKNFEKYEMCRYDTAIILTYHFLLWLSGPFETDCVEDLQNINVFCYDYEVEFFQDVFVALQSTDSDLAQRMIVKIVRITVDKLYADNNNYDRFDICISTLESGPVYNMRQKHISFNIFNLENFTPEKNTTFYTSLTTSTNKPFAIGLTKGTIIENTNTNTSKIYKTAYFNGMIHNRKNSIGQCPSCAIILDILSVPEAIPALHNSY